MELYLVITLSVMCGATSAFLFHSGDEWDDLKVTWGLNPFSSQNFHSLPRTKKDAENRGWVQISECDSSAGALFRGQRFKKTVHGIILLFDINGFIAGIQAEVVSGSPHDYPAAGLVPPFVRHGNDYYLTVYFTDPGFICTKGRTLEDFELDGTGADLHIQTGPRPDSDVMRVPRLEEDLASTKWVEGKCLWTMGKHYWYDIGDDMSCDEIFPVFLLYNGGSLNGLGWALTTPVPGDQYEHPGPFSYQLFMKSVPKCLMDRGEITTMHIFLTSYPRLNLC